MTCPPQASATAQELSSHRCEDPLIQEAQNCQRKPSGSTARKPRPSEVAPLRTKRMEFINWPKKEKPLPDSCTESPVSYTDGPAKPLTSKPPQRFNRRRHWTIALSCHRITTTGRVARASQRSVLIFNHAGADSVTTPLQNLSYVSKEVLRKKGIPETHCVYDASSQRANWRSCFGVTNCPSTTPRQEMSHNAEIQPTWTTCRARADLHPSLYAQLKRRQRHQENRHS